MRVVPRSYATQCVPNAPALNVCAISPVHSKRKIIKLRLRQRSLWPKETFRGQEDIGAGEDLKLAGIPDDSILRTRNSQPHLVF